MLVLPVTNYISSALKHSCSVLPVEVMLRVEPGGSAHTTS
jgi:hypothetical protein